ncbi:DUF5713 family protein [Streptomyces sp. QTS137]
MPLTNAQVTAHAFLRDLFRDGRCPDHVVDRGRGVLFALCARIEAERPAGLPALHVLTHAATEEFNDPAAAFVEASNEIETVSREATARTARTRLCPGRARCRPGRSGQPSRAARWRQLRDASASFHVADGRMTAAAFAGSGW